MYHPDIIRPKTSTKNDFRNNGPRISRITRIIVKKYVIMYVHRFTESVVIRAKK
jgi:hypothetical protein